MKGSELKTLREQAGLTQQQLAEKVGVSRKTINSHENSDLIPDAKSKMYNLFFENVTKSYKHEELERVSEDNIDDFKKLYSTGINGDREIDMNKIYDSLDIILNYYDKYSNLEEWKEFEEVIRSDERKKIAKIITGG